MSAHNVEHNHFVASAESNLTAAAAEHPLPGAVQDAYGKGAKTLRFAENSSGDLFAGAKPLELEFTPMKGYG